MITCINPKSQYLAYQTQIDEAIYRTLKSDRYILGQEVLFFEKEFAEFIGVSHCIGVGSATDAIQIALRAFNVGAGDEVITVSYTAVATVAAIELAGAIPVLVDIELDGFNMDPAKLQKALSPKTKAVILVHLYGHPAQVKQVLEFTRQHNLVLIEDCSQAHGATVDEKMVGSFGHAACFSFYPTKNLGGIGDGGAVVTNDVVIAARCRALREYGWDEKRDSMMPGLNSRLDELQAAVLRVKLRNLGDDNKRRNQVADFYNRHLAGLELVLPAVRKGSGHVYHLYVVRTSQRDQLKQFLADKGIQTMIHYALPVHLQSAYKIRVRAVSMEHTEKSCKEILSLPMYPQLKQEELITVINGIKDFYKEAL